MVYSSTSRLASLQQERNALSTIIIQSGTSMIPCASFDPPYKRVRDVPLLRLRLELPDKPNAWPSKGKMAPRWKMMEFVPIEFEFCNSWAYASVCATRTSQTSMRSHHYICFLFLVILHLLCLCYTKQMAIFHTEAYAFGGMRILSSSVVWETQAQIARLVSPNS